MADSGKSDPSQSSCDAYALDDQSIQDPPKSLWVALTKIGPGIILAGSIIGTGELLLTTGLGAEYGFAFLWLILFSCIVKVFVQIELGRYAISSGQPTLAALHELPGPRLGTHWICWWWLVMMLASIFQLGAMAGGVGQALNLAFPDVAVWLALAAWSAEIATNIPPILSMRIADRPEDPWAVLTGLSAVALLASGGYKRIERITTAMVAGVTLVTVICVALLPGTKYSVDINDVKSALVINTTLFTGTAIAAAFSTFGITGVGASELFAYPYWCLEKGYARFAGPRTSDPAWAERARGWLRVMHLDAWVSMIVFTVATVAFYTLGATILYKQHLVPKREKMIETLSQMYIPTFGTWTQLFFLIGVWAVLFKTMYVSSAGNGRMLADFVGLTKAVTYERPEQRHRWILRFSIALPAIGTVLYLFWRDPKVMTIIGGFFQAATLPIIAGAAVYLRYFRTDPRLAPSRFSDLCLWFAFLSMAACSLYAIPQWAIGTFWPK
jgi:Mn2+/Fe2+ NRAMP family transporter